MNTRFLSVESLESTPEETVSHELEAVVSLRTLEVRLQIAVFYDGQRIGIQVQGTVLIVNTLALIDDVLIETALSLDGGGSIYPMNGTFYFSAVRCVSALGLGIVSGMITVMLPFSSFSQPVQVTK